MVNNLTAALNCLKGTCKDTLLDCGGQCKGQKPQVAS